MVLEVRCLTTLGLGHWLEVLGPLPSWLKHGPTNRPASEVEQLQLALLELPEFIGGAEFLDLGFRHVIDI
jgi:hypothetical protein